MFSAVVLAVSLLVLGGGLMIYEARTGRLTGATRRRSLGRLAIFFAGAASGAALLISTAGAEWLFALAFVPVTVLCLLRFTMLVRHLAPGWGPALLSSLMLALAVLYAVQWLPLPLDRAYVVEQIRLIDEARQAPDSINPDARRTVRS
ncbi:MAG: hypothetical protein AAFV01_11980 [Bacteroidota bacterium]